MANTILVTIEEAGEDNEVHDITAKRSNLFDVMVRSSHVLLSASFQKTQVGRCEWDSLGMGRWT